MKNTTVPFDTLFECEDILVVNKPSLLPSLPGGMNDDSKNLLNLVRTVIPGAQLCHRLDKETSGALIIAKNNLAYKHISLQFEKREIGKKYHALVTGNAMFNEFKVDIPLVKKGIQSMVDREKGQGSITIVNSIKEYRGHTLLECSPLTGRFHQIRVHLSAIGFPIVGDKIYGGKLIFLSELKQHYKPRGNLQENPLIKRTALHSYELKFKNLKNDWITVRANYTKDFEVLLKVLNKYGLK